MRITLTAIVARQPATSLLPRAFMITWHGVPALIYQGFSPSLAALKRTIAAELQNLPPEAPGSRWPKTNLGALPDNRPLSLDELRRLRAVCDRMSAELVADAAALKVQRLQWIDYECRSLERRLENFAMEMRLTDTASLPHTPEAAERRRVETILREFSATNLAAYLNLVNREGHRIDHYRRKTRGRVLAFDLQSQAPPLVEPFIAAVEDVLPGRYAWFSPSSRHVTLRRLSA
jgi:hypothetical protein